MEGDETTMGVATAAAPPDTMVTLRVLFEPENDRPRPALPLGRDPFIVGRSSEGTTLRLADRRTSRKHAVFTRLHERRAHLQDVSSNGTFVNGKPMREPAEVEDGDLVRVGDSFILVRVVSTHPPRDAKISSLDGRHPKVCALRHTIAAVAPTDAKVLIIGETGTGKELVARAIHERSGRQGRFVAVNCGAIPSALAESELFGHVPGAFTGAQKAHSGFLRAAEGGTLFLDEIGELPLDLQPKLLRALEELVVVPVGSTKPQPIDLRLVAATHRELLAEVDAGRFREDLYARVAGYLIHTIPLRHRIEDLLPLLRTFLGEDAPPLSPDLVEGLLLHPFRFNVRELRELATQLRIDGAGQPALDRALIAARLERRETNRTMRSTARINLSDLPRRPPPTREELEELMKTHGGNISRIAKELDRSRRQVHRYLERFEIDVVDG